MAVVCLKRYVVQAVLRIRQHGTSWREAQIFINANRAGSVFCMAQEGERFNGGLHPQQGEECEGDFTALVGDLGFALIT